MDYVKKPALYQRAQFTGDTSTFLADLQAASSWWYWAVFAGADGTALVQAQSNVQEAKYFQVPPNGYLVFRNSGTEYPYVDSDGSSVDPA